MLCFINLVRHSCLCFLSVCCSCCSTLLCPLSHSHLWPAGAPSRDGCSGMLFESESISLGKTLEPNDCMFKSFHLLGCHYLENLIRIASKISNPSAVEKPASLRSHWRFSQALQPACAEFFISLVSLLSVLSPFLNESPPPDTPMSCYLFSPEWLLYPGAVLSRHL